MQHGLLEMHFTSYEDVRKWVDSGRRMKEHEKEFFYRGIHLLPVRWAKKVANNGQYFD
jgi:hypothetical protein